SRFPMYASQVIPDFMDQCRGILISSLLALGWVQGSDQWMQLNNTHGWSIAYPASWEAYVMQAPDSGPELSVRESENVNFDGPKDCYERKARCGHFQLYSASTTPQTELKKYVDEETQNQKIIQKKPANSTECRRTSLGFPKISVW